MSECKYRGFISRWIKNKNARLEKKKSMGSKLQMITDCKGFACNCPNNYEHMNLWLVLIIFLVTSVQIFEALKGLGSQTVTAHFALSWFITKRKCTIRTVSCLKWTTSRSQLIRCPPSVILLRIKRFNLFDLFYNPNLHPKKKSGEVLLVPVISERKVRRAHFVSLKIFIHSLRFFHSL